MSQNPIQPGAAAPDFNLDDQEGNKRSLSDFTGKGKPVVLFFYCLDWSPVCGPEMEGLVEGWGALSEKADLVAIGVDSRFSHKAWSDHLGVPFPILSDRTGETMKAYGLWNEDALIARRSTVYLDPEGTVKEVEVGETGQGRDIPAVIEKARSLASS